MHQREVVIRLNSPSELFESGASDMFSEDGRLVTGIDELVQEVSACPGASLHATFLLPTNQVKPDTQMCFRQSIDRYCRLRQRQNETERRTEWRDVLGSFKVGLVLFILGFVLSFYFNQGTLPPLLKLLFGDGVSLVIAWVGLWYPLDEFVHYRRRLIRDQKVFAAIPKIGISVRGADSRPTAVDRTSSTTAR
ncbi:MAG: hypothetical protein GIW94_10595 [Candidatus Eremiobacteraeota bacterium]|nr:hypothetical protein [Candidatus Eremiobacteraeota bacterium]